MAGISMKELAGILGVSTASISVALRGKPGISEETRRRILTEAKNRGYDMSRLSMADSKGIIEIIDHTYYGYGRNPGDLFPYYSQFTDAAAAEIIRSGYTAAGPFPPAGISPSERPEADGLLILGGGMTPGQLDAYINGPVPFVVAGNPLEDQPVTTVTHDNYYGICMTVTHLYEQGHRQIGYIQTLTGAPTRERYEAYVRELSRRQLSASSVWDFSGSAAISTNASAAAAVNSAEAPSAAGPDHTAGSFLKAPDSTEALIARMDQMLDAHPPMATAYICDNDFAAAAFMRVLRSHGFTPGKDIAVTGFDNQPFSALLEPPLTSVHTFEPELAVCSVQQLIYTMEHPEFQFRHIKIGTKLVVRESTQTHV